MDFTEGNVTKKLLKFATPLFLAQLLQILYNMVDMIIVGKFVGKVGLSAVSVGGDITNFLNFLVMGFANAGSVIIAQYIGAKKKRRVGEFIGTFSFFAIIVTISVSTICLLFRKSILMVLNTPSEAFNDALSYATVTISGFIFIYGYNAVSAILRGLGDSKHPFIFIAISAGLNVLLDLLFIVKFDLRAFGAALATVIAEGLSFILCINFLIKNKEKLDIDIDRSCFRINKRELNTLLRLGIPMAIKMGAVNFSKLFVNSFVNSFGITVSAACGVCNKIASLINQLAMSFNAAASSMVGQNIGALKFDRVKKILVSVFLVVLIMVSIFGIFMGFIPEVIYGIFTDDIDVIDVCMDFVPISFILLIACATRAPSNALINGCANYKMNFLVAILDAMILRIGLAYLFGLVLNYGYTGFWLGDAIAGFTPIVLATLYFVSGKWKTRKYVIKEDE